MKAAVLYGYNQPLKIEDVPVPKATGASVLIKVAGCGVCHSDVHLWKGELTTTVPPYFPLIPGHEVSGTVVEVGELVPPTIYPGLDVVVYFAYCEQEDKYFLRGLYQLCGLRVPAGMYMYNGGYAEYMLIPHYRYVVPAQGLEDLAAASILGCAGITAMRAVKKIASEVEEDEYVAVVGLGGLGSLALQLTKVLTGARVIGIDVREDKIKVASKVAKLGKGDALIDASKVDVRRAVMEATEGQSVKALLDFVGSEATIGTYLDLIAPLGVYVLVGLGAEYGPKIPIHKLVVNEISIKSVFYGSYRELQTLIDLARRGLVNYRDLVTKIKLEDINDALQRLDRGEAPTRQVISFEEGA